MKPRPLEAAMASLAIARRCAALHRPARTGLAGGDGSGVMWGVPVLSCRGRAARFREGDRQSSASQPPSAQGWSDQPARLRSSLQDRGVYWRGVLAPGGRGVAWAKVTPPVGCDVAGRSPHSRNGENKIEGKHKRRGRSSLRSPSSKNRPTGGLAIWVQDATGTAGRHRALGN